jgi:hypothetical protein
LRLRWLAVAAVDHLHEQRLAGRVCCWFHWTVSGPEFGSFQGRLAGEVSTGVSDELIIATVFVVVVWPLAGPQSGTIEIRSSQCDCVVCVLVCLVRGAHFASINRNCSRQPLVWGHNADRRLLAGAGNRGPGPGGAHNKERRRKKAKAMKKTTRRDKRSDMSASAIQ